MQYSPCIDAIYSNEKEINLEERIRSVKRAGFSSYEFWSWWDKDTQLIKRVNKEEGLTISTMCTKLISLVEPSKREEYIDGLKESIIVAKELGVNTLITQTGNDLNIDRTYQIISLIEGVRACIPLLEEAKVTLLIEPLNVLIDHKGYFLSKSDEAEQLVRAINSDYVKILFDVYHQQITEGNLTVNIQRMIDIIGHFHFADNPGRNAPGTGEINYKHIIKVLNELNYKGHIGLEFFPRSNTYETMKSVAQNYNLSSQ